YGHVPVETALHFKHDTATVELSTCQFVLAKGESIDVSPVSRRAKNRNQRIFRAMQLEVGRGGANQVATTGVGRLSYQNRIWKDCECELEGEEFVDLMGRTFQLIVIVHGERCNLRFAAGRDLPGQPYAHVGELHLAAQPGCNLFSFATDQLRTLRGTPDYSRV